jgi:two-component system nitrogen regulation sensor histidine kinase NtrY
VRFERRLRILTFCAALPSLATALALLWIADMTNEARLTVAFVLVAATLFLLNVVHHRLTFPLRTLANVAGAIREEDYSLRARGAAEDDALGELAVEINRLADDLRERHLDDRESSALVRAILAELDAAIFLFDRDGRLRQMNRAAEHLLRIEREEAAGRTIAELGLADCIVEPARSTVDLTFPGGAGRWSIRRSTFREKGRTHSLLAISDVSRALRDEELLAWQRLVRVLSHELNNSLASIHSTAETLQQIVLAEEPAADWRDDAKRGFGIIVSRVDSLTRFTRSYARLARLPRPDFAPWAVAALAGRVASMTFALPVRVVPGPDAIVLADGDQLDQLLINLVQNAVDASLETNGGVTVTWRLAEKALELSVLDDGPGLSATTNLFVPFFTTKPGGTGIGLVLSRQIAEAHGGSLKLTNRAGGGCEARLVLPRFAWGHGRAHSTA